MKGLSTTRTKLYMSARVSNPFFVCMHDYIELEHATLELINSQIPILAPCLCNPSHPQSCSTWLTGVACESITPYLDELLSTLHGQLGTDLLLGTLVLGGTTAIAAEVRVVGHTCCWEGQTHISSCNRRTCTLLYYLTTL